MLHQDENDEREFLQVELNTIAASFGALSTKVSAMHRAVYGDDRVQIPENTALESIARGMQCAHHEYVNQTGAFDSVILILVQGKERNFADQRHIQHVLLEKYRIKSIRATFSDIKENGDFSGSTGEFKYQEKEVSLVYFRSGYSPDDYMAESDWGIRLKIELSKAIKCPNIAYHLAGTKKIQQVLADPGILEQFLKDEDCRIMRKVFAGLYNLSEESSSSAVVSATVEKALLFPLSFVLKPQREGGGNNFYGSVNIIEKRFF
jgi:glutathione synthase